MEVHVGSCHGNMVVGSCHGNMEVPAILNNNYLNFPAWSKCFNRMHNNINYHGDRCVDHNHAHVRATACPTINEVGEPCTELGMICPA